MPSYASQIIQITGYARAVLTALVLLRCAFSMLQEKYEPEIWGYLTLPGGESRALNHWECILGRSRSADIQLTQGGLGRCHAVLQRSARGRWTVYDLHCRGGTRVNGQLVRSHARVRNGDELQLNEMKLRFVDLSAAQRRTLQRRRSEPGKRYRQGLTLLLLTNFQLLLMLEHCLTAQSRYVPPIEIAFAILMGLEWFCFFLFRSRDYKGYEVETLAFFLSSVGLSVTASSEPGGMLKASALLLMGVAVFTLLGWWLRDLRRVKLLRWPMAICALGLLGLNLLLSEEVFGARNWLIVFGVSIQPSELVKVAYVYAGAATLNRIFRKRNLLLYIVFSAIIVCVMALLGDFGTALVFFTCFLVVSYMRSGSFATVLLAVSGASLAGMLVLTAKPYVARRFATWGHVWDDPLGAGYQQVRAMSATASGGLFGQGAGRGWLKSVAAADTDLVFGMVAEELGLVVAFGCLAAIILLALFTVRNASAGRSSYYVIAACAAVTIMMVQTSLNVFGSLDILPFTGVTLPFVSRGGSSLISCWAMLAYIKAGDTRQNASFALTDGLEDEEYGEEYGEYEDDGEEYGSGEEDGSAGDEGGEDGEE